MNLQRFLLYKTLGDDVEEKMPRIVKAKYLKQSNIK